MCPTGGKMVKGVCSKHGKKCPTAPKQKSSKYTEGLARGRRKNSSGY